MLFNSYAFLLVFLPIAVVIFSFADPHPKARIPVLIALSFAFYGYWNAYYLALLIPSILLNWFAANLYAHTKRSEIVVAAIAANLGVLATFKYNNFIAANFAAVTGLSFTPFDLALPLGISFFTFHHIMYLADLRRGIAPLFSLKHYALYICFFPQVLSGPLVRWNEIMHQFGRPAFVAGWQKRISVAAIFVVGGLLQKVALGDPLAQIVDPLYERAATGPLTMYESWLAVLGFTFQIFFDFSGYTDIAIGVALIFGIELPRNFDAPYRSTSIRDFWRRWHMTLSRFLRDYLYIPLGGNRHGLAIQFFALLATMVLGGLWHGAGWGFILWGFLHGAALAINVVWRRFLPPLPTVIAWFVTFTFVALTWVAFRSPSFAAAMKVIDGLAFGSAHFGPYYGRRTIAVAAACAILLPSSFVIYQKLSASPRPALAIGLGVVATYILVAIGSDASYEFIYFRF